MKTSDSDWRSTLSPLIHVLGLILYCYLLFQNAIDLNELTVAFSIFYFITWLLISVYLKYGKLIHKPLVHVLIIICLLSQIVLISFKALTDDTEQVAATHRELF